MLNQEDWLTIRTHHQTQTSRQAESPSVSLETSNLGTQFLGSRTGAAALVQGAAQPQAQVRHAGKHHLHCETSHVVLPQVSTELFCALYTDQPCDTCAALLKMMIMKMI